MKLEGKLQGLHIAEPNQGLSSIRIQINPSDPNGICIVNCDHETVGEFAKMIGKFLSVTIEPMSAVTIPKAFQPKDLAAQAIAQAKEKKEPGA